MAEPDPKPQIEVTTLANGSGPPKDSGAEAVQVNKLREEIKGLQVLKVGKDDNGAAEKEEEEGKQSVEETKDGLENEEDDKAKNNSGEAKEGGEKDDVKETNDMEETKEMKGKSGIKEMNGVEETNGGEDKDSVNNTNSDKDTKEVEEKMSVEEMEGEEKLEDGEEKESSALKRDEEGKVDKDKGVEDQEEGKGEKVNEDVEMAEAENVKEEDKMATDERVEDGGGKSEEKDDVKDKKDGMHMGKEGDDNKKVKGLKKKRSRSRRKVYEKGEAKEKKEEAKNAGEAKEKKEETKKAGEKEEAKEKKEETKKAGEAKEKKEEAKKVGEAKEKNEGMKKPKEPLTSPRPSSIDRPVRERKTVERLLEVIQKETNKGVVIEKGRGTPLKDIPNVAHKLGTKKPGDLKLLHQVLFGRKGKAVDFKNHILQFSGFAWHESDEKQRAKLKERLDKHVKDALLDLCDLLDISVSKANAKKEDIIVKLLDFVAAPSATTDALFAEKEQDSPKSLKRKRVARGSASKGTEDVVPKKSRKKRIKSERKLSSRETAAPDTEDKDDGEEEEDNENVTPEEDEELAHSEGDKENESKEASEKDEGEDDDFGKDKHDKKRSPKKQNSSKKEKVKVEGSFKTTPSVTASKRPSKTPSSTHSKSDVRNDEGEKVFVRKKKQVDLLKKKSTSKSDINEKSSGKRSTGGKPKPEGAGQSIPSKEDMRKTICEILRKVDFNTATFTDILKPLASHYRVDLTPQKATIKLLIQEELAKLADEAEENEDDGDSEEEEHPKAEGKKVEV